MTGEAYTLDQFLADARSTVRTKGMPAGLAEIRRHLERLLANRTLLELHLGRPVAHTNRTTIAHDPETDIHVLVHGRQEGGRSMPHDHGPCWVVYGSYTGYTRMRRWRRLDGGRAEGHAELELAKDWKLEAGHAEAFAVGDIHSIEYPPDTFFIRVTGGDVEKQVTLRYNLETKTAELADRSQGARA